MDLSSPRCRTSSAGRRATFLEANAEPTWAQLAELGWTGASVAEEHGGAGLTFVEEAVLHEEAGRALLHAPLWSTSLLLPFLPGTDQAAVAAGEASWTLALGPLVPDLDTATHVAVVGGDTIWQLEGFEREVLATSDETRPLGVVSGGEAGRALCLVGRAALAPRAVARDPRPRGRGRGLPRARARVELRRRARAVRPADRLVPGGVAPARELATRRSSSPGRSPGGRRGASPTTSRTRPSRLRRRRRTQRTPPCSRCERAIQAHGGIGFTWEHVLHRLYKRALAIQSWEASSAQLRAEVASHLLDEEGR